MHQCVRHNPIMMRRERVVHGAISNAASADPIHTQVNAIVRKHRCEEQLDHAKNGNTTLWWTLRERHRPRLLMFTNAVSTSY